MIKKTITYEDFDGNTRTDDFYFHMNQTEFTKLNGEVPGGIQDYMNEIQKNGDEDGLLRLIDTIVSRSYGERDKDDGSFTKIGKNGRPLYEKFVNTDAYDKLMIELIQNDRTIMAFLTGIFPKDVQKKFNDEIRKLEANGTVVSKP